MEYNRNSSYEELERFCTRADAVFHLAAVLRPETLNGFNDNINLTSHMICCLEKCENKCPIMFASSIQADLNNPYGNCKRVEEKKFIEYGKRNSINTYIFRFPNLFGIMSKPNYTSVIATFCYNTIKELPVIVNDPAVQIKFAFIEDILKRVINVVFTNKNGQANQIITIDKYYCVGLGELAYYMQTLKLDSKPKIIRDDDFYEKLKYVYEWYKGFIKKE